MPGREAREKDDARGRSLTVAVFERDPDRGLDEVVVRRQSRSSTHLTLKPSTLAELLASCGVESAPAADVTDRTIEIQLEAQFLEHDLTSYTHERVLDPDDDWVFKLADPVPTDR